LGGSRRSSRGFGEEKSLLPLLSIELRYLGLPVRITVTLQTGNTFRYLICLTIVHPWTKLHKVSGLNKRYILCKFHIMPWVYSRISKKLRIEFCIRYKNTGSMYCFG
jgi:hypothetical protein